MKDREFLTWIHARLVRNGDSPSCDFMHRLRGIVKATPPDAESKPFAGILDATHIIVMGRKIRQARAVPAPTASEMISKRTVPLGGLLTQCKGKRDRECLFRLHKEAAIVAQDFEAAMLLRQRQHENISARR